MKTLWIVSGSEEAVPGIIKAKQMGFFVAVSDKNPEAPGFEYADDAVIASTYDVEETVSAAVQYNKTTRQIDGVISVAADVPKTVASIANALHLPGISLETAELASNKYKMKKHFAETGIPVPWFSPVYSSEELKEIIKKKGFPLILKPTDSRGARGVLQLIDGTDLNWAFNEAQKHSPSNNLIVEEFIKGPQISTEAIVLDGIGYTLGFCDRNYECLEEFAPFIIENGGTQPSSLSSSEKEEISDLAIRAGKALGVSNGVVKGDMVLSDSGPMVIEIAPRLSGGWLSTDQIPLHTGVDFVGNAIKLALAIPINPGDLQAKHERAVAIRYFFPPVGHVKEIPKLSDIMRMPGVYKAKLFIKVGELIEPVTDHTKRAGFVITYGDNRQDAIVKAQEVVKRVETTFAVE